MQPVRFTCSAALSLPPEAVAAQILDVANWSDFQGYGPLPGIREARFELRTPEVVGSHIRVTNTDGSSHVEEIAEWDLPRRLRLEFKDFSPPLSRLATRFDETWEFQRIADQTHVVRSMALHPRARWTKPVLWLISLLLRRAIARHLQQLAQQRSPAS